MIGSLLRVRYELLQELGESPVFQTYVAHDRVTERNVVVRALRPEYSSEPKFVAALRAAVEKSKRVDHPSVSRAQDFDEDEGRWFIVYQYSAGQSLGERIKKVSAFTVSTSVATAINVLEGLDAIHSAGLVHGDVSARNVVVSQGGGATVLMPCIWESYTASDKAGVEMLPLLAPYISPEVTAGEFPSQASDVYATGVLLFEMLTGERPFRGKTPVEVATAHANKPVPLITETVSAAPEALERILCKAMAKSKLDRYQSASEMLSDLGVLRDAMRFGRPLTWPLSPAKAEEGQRVGPKLNVVRGEEKEQRVARKRAKDRGDGAPAWLVYVSIFAMVGAIGVVGWWAYFNLQAPKTLLVPGVVGMSFNQASAQFDDMNLTLRIVRRVPSEEYAEGVIVSLQPSVGRDVKEGAFVDAVVSSGSRFVEVPDLKGMGIDEARRLLSSLKLSMSTRIKYVRDWDVPKGLIVSQSPAMHVQVERQSQVSVTASNGNERVGSDPPLTDAFVYNLRWQLPDWPTPILVKIEMTDQRGTRLIHEELHEPGEWVSSNAQGYGDEATFLIYYDNELIRKVTQRAREEQDVETIDLNDEIERLMQDLDQLGRGGGQ